MMERGEMKQASCRAACPAGVDVPRYIRHIRKGEFNEALAVIRESIPFPAVCGYACAHPCESQCARRQYDAPLAIRLLKRAAADAAGEQWEDRHASQPPTGKRVAVVGSGPGGLTAAYYLAGQGHAVTVFESLPAAGGMLRYGIPGYRLPNAVVDRDIAAIVSRGVAIETNRRVDSPEMLLRNGFDAVIVATGAWRPTGLGGETEVAGVVDGVSFLKAVNSGAPVTVGSQVVVVGGGDTAIDSARSALRLGAREVHLLYRRTRSEMPASPEEVSDALEEGVQIQFSTAPVTVQEGSLLCVKTALGPADESGRARPVPVEGSEFAVPFDTLIIAAGQSAEGSALGLASRSNGTVQVDDTTLATGISGIFAAGDTVSGPSTIIEAIAQGKRAAAAVDRFLGGSGVIGTCSATEPVSDLPEEAPRGSCRTEVEKLPLDQRLEGFLPVELGYDAESAAREAHRCLSCDQREFQVTVNPVVCKQCGYCKEVCGQGIFEVSDGFNASGFKPMTATRSEKCVGCLRCLMICPDFAIGIEAV